MVFASTKQICSAKYVEAPLSSLGHVFYERNNGHWYDYGIAVPVEGQSTIAFKLEGSWPSLSLSQLAFHQNHK